MKISIQDSAQMSRDFYEVFPRDLVEDLAEEEPQVAQTSENLDTLLLTKRKELETQKTLEDELWNDSVVSPNKKIQETHLVRPVFAKDTLVVPGWDRIKKGQKNWSDFENLMFLYALGNLFSAQNMPEKAKHDKAELTYAVEKFDRLKRPEVKKHLTAEKRLAGDKAYIRFGKRTIDASCISDEQSRIEALRDLEDECHEAMAGNEFNGWKLKKAYHIARRVMKTLRQRY